MNIYLAILIGSLLGMVLVSVTDAIEGYFDKELY